MARDHDRWIRIVLGHLEKRKGTVQGRSSSFLLKEGYGVRPNIEPRADQC